MYSTNVLFILNVSKKSNFSKTFNLKFEILGWPYSLRELMTLVNCPCASS